MQLHPVTSSNLSAIGYNHATQVLRVKFAHGGIYEYQGVSPVKFKRLESAKSKGGYFAAQISSNPIYKGRRLEPHEI